MHFKKRAISWLLAFTMLLGICQNLIASYGILNFAGTTSVAVSTKGNDGELVFTQLSSSTTESAVYLSPEVNGKQVTFSYYSATPIEGVSVAGGFNDWDKNKNQMTKDESSDIWSITLEVPYGRSEYKFVIEGNQWIADPQNPNKTSSADPNSIVVVPGIVVPFYEDVQRGSEMLLPEQIIVYGESGAAQLAAVYSLESIQPGVTLDGNRLQVASEVTDNTISVKVAAGGIDTLIDVNVVNQVYVYTINYLRKDDDYDNWNIWMWNIGKADASVTFNKGIQADKYIQAQHKFSATSVNFKMRKSVPGNDWDEEDIDGVIKIPAGKTNIDVWIIQGNPEVFYSYPDESEVEPLPTRCIVFEYVRPDGDYTDWNIWMWATGAKEGQINFNETKDGKAIAYVEIGPAATSIGYVLRKGTDWAVKDFPSDRFISAPKDQVITKIRVTAMQEKVRTFAPATAPVINPQDSTIKFYYRDDALFKLSQMDDIISVKVEINNQDYSMTYDADNELYQYTYNGLVPGKYAYVYKVTSKDGSLITLLDSKNKRVEDGKSVIEYKKANIAVSGIVEPGAINYDQNAVLQVTAVGAGEDAGKEISIKEITVDLTALGGKSKVQVDNELKALTVAVTDNITAGVKKIPIYVMDESSNIYEGETTVEVKPMTALGKEHFDWDEAIIYFMMTDRFYNGDTSNDDPYGIGYRKADRGSPQGGDFKGVTAKLDYLKNLGVNTIWITPIVENIGMNVLEYENAYGNRSEVGDDVSYYGYHGYWAKDFERLNPHLGTLADFHKLIDEAHNKGMKIMVDIVVNHTGYGLKETDTQSSFGASGEVKNFPSKDDQDRFAGMLRAGGNDSVQGELAGLPDFITENPTVRNKIVQWQVNWVDQIAKTANGNTIDYFRIDTAKHVEPATLMALKNELTNVKSNFKYIVEAWASAADVDYFLNSGMGDALLNFDFKHIARDFVDGKIDSAEARLQEINNKVNSAYTYGNFLGSHDESGFLYNLGTGNEDKLKVAATIQMTSKGQPVIYYGEELGLTGADNWPYYSNRYNMNWDLVNDDNDIYTHYKKIINIRAKYSQVFAKGTRTKIAGGDSEKYIAFERAYQGNKIIVAVNTRETQEVNLTVPFAVGSKVIDEYSGAEYTVTTGNRVTVTLPSTVDGGTIILTAKPNNDGGSGGGSGSGSGGGSGSSSSGKTPVVPVVPVVPVTSTTPKVVKISFGNGLTSSGGENLSLYVKPYIKDNRTMVGVRDMAMLLNVDSKNIIWNGKDKSVLIKTVDKEIKFVIGQKYVMVNGEKIVIDVAPEIKEGRIVLPLVHIAKLLGIKVEYDPKTKEVTLTIN